MNWYKNVLAFGEHTPEEDEYNLLSQQLFTLQRWQKVSPKARGAIQARIIEINRRMGTLKMYLDMVHRKTEKEKMERFVERT